MHIKLSPCQSAHEPYQSLMHLSQQHARALPNDNAQPFLTAHLSVNTWPSSINVTPSPMRHSTRHSTSKPFKRSASSRTDQVLDVREIHTTLRMPRRQTQTAYPRRASHLRRYQQLSEPIQSCPRRWLRTLTTQTFGVAVTASSKLSAKHMTYNELWQMEAEVQNKRAERQIPAHVCAHVFLPSR